jgi:hypothetical protein
MLSLQSVFKGSGLYMTNNAIKNPNITSSFFDWYVITDSIMSNTSPQVKEILANGKPKILQVGNGNSCFDDLNTGTICNPQPVSENTIQTMKDLITKNKSKIVGVVWDYERQHVPANTAITDLNKIRSYSNSLGLPFGVVTFRGNLITDYLGLNYSQLASYSDFAMPMIYCQWWLCDRADLTQNEWTGTINAAASYGKPIVPLTALRATSKDLPGPGPITPTQLVSNYGALNPRPASIGYWNPDQLTQELANVIGQVEASSEAWLTVKINQGDCDQNIGHGKVTFNPSGGYDWCTNNCAQRYKFQSWVNMYAGTEGSGCMFDHWEGPACTGPNCGMSMIGDYTISAVFKTEKAKLNLKINQGDCNVAVAKGKVTFTPSGGSASCTTDCVQNYPINSNISMKAEATGSSCVFDHWEGPACTGPNCEMSMIGDYTISAVFKKAPLVQLNLKIDQGNCNVAVAKGKVTFTPSGGSASCTTNCVQNYPINSNISMKATTTGSSCVFDHWHWDLNGGVDQTLPNPYPVNMDKSYTVTAVYRKL